jgi:hypothetical protein
MGDRTFLGLEKRNAMLEHVTGVRLVSTVFATIDTLASPHTLPGAVEAILAGYPQAIVLGSNDVASAAFVEAARSAGYKRLFHALSGVGHGLGGLLGPLVAGISVTKVVPLPSGDSRVVSIEHRAFCARHGIKPTAYALRMADGGIPVVDVCRQVGISEARFYTWKKKYGELRVSCASSGNLKTRTRVCGASWPI